MLESNCVCNNDYTGDAMKITCPECNSNSRIYSRNEQSEQFSDLYCNCTRCGTRFVMNLSFSHLLKKESENIADAIALLVSRLESDSKKEVIDRINSLA